MTTQGDKITMDALTRIMKIAQKQDDLGNLKLSQLAIRTAHGLIGAPIARIFTCPHVPPTAGANMRQFRAWVEKKIESAGWACEWLGFDKVALTLDHDDSDQSTIYLNASRLAEELLWLEILRSECVYAAIHRAKKPEEQVWRA